MRLLNTVTLVLVILGALNWGLMGLFQLDLVATLFAGPQTTISRILYILVGLSGLYQISHLADAFAGEGADRNERARTGYDRRR
jgi:uncharacterized protein